MKNIVNIILNGFVINLFVVVLHLSILFIFIVIVVVDTLSNIHIAIVVIMMFFFHVGLYTFHLRLDLIVANSIGN